MSTNRKSRNTSIVEKYGSKQQESSPSAVYSVLIRRPCEQKKIVNMLSSMLLVTLSLWYMLKNVKVGNLRKFS